LLALDATKLDVSSLLLIICDHLHMPMNNNKPWRLVKKRFWKSFLKGRNLKRNSNDKMKDEFVISNFNHHKVVANRSKVTLF
jgi:hypothetical protein